MNAPTIEAALADVTQRLLDMGRRFALVGGLAVSFRAEVRFTRDVDVAVGVTGDADLEALVFGLRASGYLPIATVEHTQQQRLATARLQSPLGFVVDLLAASCGIEQEVVERATVVDLPGVGQLPIARSEELLAMKVLSMSDRRLQDRIDARNREEDLHAKLASLLAEVTREE
jgi:hypothetical protein